MKRITKNHRKKHYSTLQGKDFYLFRVSFIFFITYFIVNNF
jgi:hypothetical protein